MLDVLIQACKKSLDDSDFWLSATLGDWTFEETSRRCFVRYSEFMEGTIA